MNTQIDPERVSLTEQQQQSTHIQNLRLRKQLEFLQSLNRNYRIPTQHEIIIEDIIYDHQDLHIHVPQEYPFKEPQYSLSGSKEEKKRVSEAIEVWTPKYKILELVELLAQRVNYLHELQNKVDQRFLMKAFYSPNTVPLILTLAILLRILLGLGSYSGKGDTPNYGDFQAHRNWMSITLNRPIQYWYDQRDISPWWRIDYPPVAAYLSYLFGAIYKTIQPQAMDIQQGYESTALKTYMRFTALLVDFVFLFPPIVLLARQYSRNLPTLLLLVLLLKPDAILIDHGHFQYNSLVLGLVLMGFYCLLNGNSYTACVLYTIALHSKQMASYFALAFLAALIGLALRQNRSRIASFVQIAKFGFIVIGVSLLIWMPWMGSFQDIKSVFQAIFPVHRGLYQLKVGNFWCLSDIVMKWETHFDKSILVAMCALSCVALSLPSILSAVLFPDKKRLTLAFATISMTFFMFSYHVHEKSILLPLLMTPFVGETIGGRLAFDLIVAGCVGMFHLLKEDQQQLGYFALVGLFYLFGSSYFRLRQDTKTQSEGEEKTLSIHRSLYDHSFVRVLMLAVVITLHIMEKTVTPPEQLPYLHNLLFATLPFVLNCYFLLVANLLQLEWVAEVYGSRFRKST